MKILKSNKLKYGTMSTVLILAFVAVMVVVNIVASTLSDRYPSMNIDMTSEGLHSLSDDAVEVAKSVEYDTTIYLIGDENVYKSNKSYYNTQGIQYNQVATVAEKLIEANPKIKVEYIDPDTNPAFISQYAEYDLNASSVLVVSEKREKHLIADDFFTIATNQTTGTQEFYTKVDGAFANALYLVNLDEVPVIAVATGHDEYISSSARATFDTLMTDNGFVVEEFNILTEEIPESTQIVMLSAPTIDYSDLEIQKLQDFLSVTDESRSIFALTYAQQGDLPNLNTFLEDWGLKTGEGIVAETDPYRMVSSSSAAMFISDVNSDFISAGDYSRNISVSASPIEFTFDVSEGIQTYPLVTTADTAFVITESTDLEQTPQTSSYTTAGIADRMNDLGSGKTTNTSVILFGDMLTLDPTFIGSSSFTNRDLLVDLMQHVTDVDETSTSLYVAQTETNIIDITANLQTIQIVGLYIGTIAVPLLVFIIAFYVFMKRRHL